MSPVIIGNAGQNEHVCKLVLDHLYLISTFIYAQIDSRSLPASIDRDDLYQQGVVILMRAALRYKNNKGAKFSTYADKCLRPALIGYIGNQRWGPKASERYRMKLKGEKVHLDMVSYDALDSKNEGTFFLDHIICNEGNSYESRMPIPGLRKILSYAEKAINKKIDKRSKTGANGVYWSQDENKFRVEIRLNGIKFRIGAFESEQLARGARETFLSSLRDECVERIENAQRQARMFE